MAAKKRRNDRLTLFVERERERAAATSVSEFVLLASPEPWCYS